MAAILATPGLVPGAKHRVRIDAFEARGVLVEVKFWIPGYAQRIPLRHKLAVNIMAFLDKAGIPCPTPPMRSIAHACDRWTASAASTTRLCCAR
jgi:small-conductance mechanosensitive channel